MATLKNTVIDDTGYLKIPAGTTAQRPVSPSNGMVRYNTDSSLVEFWNGTSWINMGGTSSYLDGSSAVNAAPSAIYIKNLTGTTLDGLYWINLPTIGPTQVYCDMNTYGGGWMLAMRLDTTLGTSTVRHYFSSSWWTNATSGVSSAPASARTNGEVKTQVYSYYPHTNIMLEYGYGPSYFYYNAKAWYSQPMNATNQQNNSLLYKQQYAYHEGGNRTFNNFTTSDYRWIKQATTNSTFFPNSYLHINFGSHANTNSHSNDFFRFWFNNVSDLYTDAPACNQIGGFGMAGDFSPSLPTYTNPSNWNPSFNDIAWNGGNASATISPPYGSDPQTCQWNGVRAAAGSSGLNYQNNTATPLGGDYYNNGVGIIWVR